MTDASWETLSNQAIAVRSRPSLPNKAVRRAAGAVGAATPVDTVDTATPPVDRASPALAAAVAGPSTPRSELHSTRCARRARK